MRGGGGNKRARNSPLACESSGLRRWEQVKRPCCTPAAAPRLQKTRKGKAIEAGEGFEGLIQGLWKGPTS